LYYLDYNLLNIFKAYLIESDKFENEKSTLDVILLSITSATALFYYLIIRNFNNKKLFFLSLIPILIIAFFLLVRGGRNPFVIFTLPLIISEFINRKISLKYILIAILILFPLTHFIAVVRGYGFEKILEYSTFNANYNPVDSEFGAPYRVLKIYYEGVINYPLQYGKTYIFDPIINLFPREIFPSRPLTIATRFSIDYFMNSKEMFGLGFSPILEIILNFTILGILPFFCLIRYILLRLDNMLLETKFQYFGYLLLFPIIINYQRIDFAVCVKLYLIELFWIAGLIYISRFKFKI
jgi:oligosaccharide repeat unit polymerase